MSRLAYLLAVAAPVSAQLTIDGVQCKELICKFDEYCSQDSNQCAPCNTVCNETHTNKYDSGLCVEKCQTYLLDLRYLRRSDVSPAANDLSGIQRQATTSLIISGVALAILLLILVIVCRGKFSWRYVKQKFQPTKNRVNQYPKDLTHHNPHTDLAKGISDMKLEIRNPEPPKRAPQPLNARDLETRTSHTEKSQGATTPKTVSTVLSNRHPAEDTTLDFSYDNMGMNVTPPENTTSSQKF